MVNFAPVTINLIILLYVLFAYGEDCPEPDCNDEKPKLENGILYMHIFYDNDDPEDENQCNAKMIRRACKVHSDFPDTFKPIFTVGSSTWKKKGFLKELHCLAHDCKEDRKEVCASLILPRKKYSKFVCCNNDDHKAKSFEKCANAHGLYYPLIILCATDFFISTERLLKNSEKRKNAGILACHLPDYILGGVYNRCKKLDDYDSLKQYVCELFQFYKIPTDDKCPKD